MATRQTGPTPNRASMNPDNAVQGGLFGDMNGTVVEAKYVHWTYPNTNTVAPALNLKIVDDSGLVWDDQIWTCGRTEVYRPSADGLFMDTDEATGFPSSSNLLALLASLVNAGFPKNRLDDPIKGCSILVGLYAFWRRQKSDRQIRGQAPPPEGRDPTVVVVSKIHKMPWENQVAGTVPAGGQAAVAPPVIAPPPIQATGVPPVPVANGTLESLAQGIVLQAVAASGGAGLDKMGLNGYIVNNPQLYGNDPTQLVPLINLVSQDAFLAAVPGVRVEGGKIVAG